MLLETWVFWTLLAAFMQSIRTAGQKQLAGVVSPLTATLVRYLFGLPFAIAYFLFLGLDGPEVPEPGPVFYLSGLTAGLLQILATVLLIRLVSMRNFAVGTTFIRTEILLTALIGVALFTEQISMFGWLAMLISVVGLILMNLSKQSGFPGIWNLSAAYGLGAGLSFALTSLFLRQASLSLGLKDAAYSAAITLVYMVILQTVVCLSLVYWQKREELSVLTTRLGGCVFIGVTSVAGSAGWFTAMTLQSASYVKTLGQIEFLFTLVLSVFYFKERPNPTELLGMGCIVIGTIVLLLA